ncbi:MAG: peptide chain release factor N(5)-glutamine methyltransferase [Boseongicola sp.]|nr:peptide chain release factor N(5)-glutamine methyltransferase [Boseongicola sp.]
MTPDEAKLWARRQLEAAGVADPAGDARRLWQFAVPDKADHLERFVDLIVRRSNREPVSHITGRRAFWKHEFTVTNEVLDPRPETETLIECALEHSFQRVLDLGTGSGCIVISLLHERPDATGLATDISEGALDIARSNANSILEPGRLELKVSDWFERIDSKFDLIVSNPPYISANEMSKLEPEVQKFEPRQALTDEADGLEAYRAITDGALDHLTEGGRLLVEIGHTQAQDVMKLFVDGGFGDVKAVRDLGGAERVISGQKR